MKYNIYVATANGSRRADSDSVQIGTVESPTEPSRAPSRQSARLGLQAQLDQTEISSSSYYYFFNKMIK